MSGLNILLTGAVDDVHFVGAMRDTDGRVMSVHADSGAIRLDFAGDSERVFLTRADAVQLIGFLYVADDYAADQQAAQDDDDLDEIGENR